MLEREKRDTAPHVAIIKFNVIVHRMLPDGSLDPEIVDCSDLFKDNEMAKNAEITVEGFDKWHCVKKIKQKLEKLNGK